MSKLTYTDCTPAAMRRALPLTRGSYQRALLAGVQAWSGATLRGKAATYSARYRRSGDNLVQRMRSRGLRVEFQRVGPGRRLVLKLRAR